MTLVKYPGIKPRRSLCFIALMVLLFGSFADGTFAQSSPSSIYSSPSRSFGRARSPFTSRPTFSPYLNLLRQGDPVLNYYGLVRPEKEFRAANEDIRAEVGEVERKLENFEEREAGSNLGVTGHHVKFMSDQQGGVGSVGQTLSDRDLRLEKLPPNPGSRIAPSGHGAYFINHGSYYRFPNRDR